MVADVVVGAGASLLGAVVGAGVAWAIAARGRDRQYKLEDRSELLVRTLLEHERWKLRTFRTIKYHVAGFEDNQLRQILIRAGAIKFEDASGIEVWGLLNRNLDVLEREVGTLHN